MVQRRQALNNRSDPVAPFVQHRVSPEAWAAPASAAVRCSDGAQRARVSPLGLGSLSFATAINERPLYRDRSLILRARSWNSRDAMFKGLLRLISPEPAPQRCRIRRWVSRYFTSLLSALPCLLLSTWAQRSHLPR